MNIVGRGGLEKWEDFMIIPKLKLKLADVSATVLKCYSLRVESTIMPYSHCSLVCRINNFAHVSYDSNLAMQFCNHLSCILYLLFCCALSDTDHTLGPRGFVFRSDLLANKCMQPTWIFV